MKNFVFSISTVLILNCLFFISCNKKNNEHSELNLEDTKIIKQFFDEALTTRETYELPPNAGSVFELKTLFSF